MGAQRRAEYHSLDHVGEAEIVSARIRRVGTHCALRALSLSPDSLCQETRLEEG